MSVLADQDQELLEGAGPDGFYGIRFESIGGLGAHLAGQMLAEAGVLGRDLNGSHFSSYGSEKKGSPVRSYVRLCAPDRAIRRSDPIERPQLVVVFHRALLGSIDVTAGLVPGGTIIVNTAESAAELRERLGLAGATVGAVDGLAIALEESTRINTVMLGAVARVCTFLGAEAIREVIAEHLGRRYPDLVEANLRSFDRGFAELELEAGTGAADNVSATDRPKPAFGFLEAPIGGTIFAPGSSIARDLSASREGFRACARPRQVRSLRPLRRRLPRPLLRVGDGGRRRRAAARHRLPVLQGVPEVHPGMSDRGADGDPRGGRLGSGPPRAALPVARGRGERRMTATLATEAAEQVIDFKSGNEMAAISAKHIDFHVMGYYPITPSTEIAENLDEMRAEGEHSIVMIPADGEHGAAGICYGASTGGGRVFNATSSQGLLYSLEQLPVQAGTRFPMLLDIATRAVSAPLDIRGDHSDIYYALDTGWLIFLARDPQAVYDLNVIALRVAERPEVQLPAMVAFDGFFTSHQKRRVRYFADPEVVRDVPRPGPRSRHGARSAPPSDDRPLHERPRPDQQQVPAHARDGVGRAHSLQTSSPPTRH